ncbi:MAG: hypothetical protein ACOH2H_15125, partial [Cypionkella sp.]
KVGSYYPSWWTTSAGALQIAAGATANSPDATLLARANHSGQQDWSTITGAPTTVAGYGITDAVKLTGAQTVAGVKTLSDPVNLGAQASDPAAPASGLLLYSKLIAGKMVSKIKGPSGLSTPLQNAFWQNNIIMWNPTGAGAGVWLGTTGTSAGSYSTALPSNTSLYTAMRRGQWANVATTANQIVGQRLNESPFLRGDSPGQGGFFFYARCGFDIWTNGGRFFAGFAASSQSIALDPSSIGGCMAFGVDAADNGAISFITRDGTSATKAPTGLTISANVGYDCYIFCAPNDTQVSWRIVDFVGGNEASGVANLTLPAQSSKHIAMVATSNAALTAAASVQIGLNRIYIETDY